MKIFHMADIHLGRRPVGGIGPFSNKRYNDYFKAFDFLCDRAIENKVDVILIAGDFFDRKELLPEVLSRAEKILKRITDNNIEIILIEGNHDNISHGKENESWLIYLEQKGYVKRPVYYFNDGKYIFEPIKIGNVNFYGLGYPGSLISETLIEFNSFLENQTDSNNILLVHTAISGADILPGTVDSKHIENLKDKVLYIAGGHFHSSYKYPKENPFFFIPGSPEYWDLAERGSRGAFLYDTESSEFTFIESEKRNILNHKFDISSKSESEFQDEFIEMIEAIKFVKDEDILYLKLNLKNSFYFDINWCEDIANKKGFLKAVIKTEYNGNDDEKIDINNSMITIEKIEEDIIKDWKYLSGDCKKTVKYLSEIKNFQKEKNKELFFDRMDHMLEELILEESDLED